MSDSEDSDSTDVTADIQVETSQSFSPISNNYSSFEPVRVLKQNLQLPKELCENQSLFFEFFTLELWKSLPIDDQLHLRSFLPTFSNDAHENVSEQNITVKKLFSNEISRFDQSPLIDFQENLESGNYRPDISRLLANILKSQRREQRFQECERLSHTVKSVLISREKLLRLAYNTPPGANLKVADRYVNGNITLSSSAAALRAKKRYFQEMSAIIDATGLIEPLSEDENYPEGPPPQLSRKQRRHLSGIQVIIFQLILFILLILLFTINE